MMKKAFCIALVAALLFSFTACGIKKITLKDFDIYKDGEFHHSFDDETKTKSYGHDFSDWEETARGIKIGDTLQDFLEVYGNNRAFIHVNDLAVFEENGDFYTPSRFIKAHGPIDGDQVEFYFAYLYPGKYRTFDDIKRPGGAPAPVYDQYMSMINFLFTDNAVIEEIYISW